MGGGNVTKGAAPQSVAVRADSGALFRASSCSSVPLSRPQVEREQSFVEMQQQQMAMMRQQQLNQQQAQAYVVRSRFHCSTLHCARRVVGLVGTAAPCPCRAVPACTAVVPSHLGAPRIAGTHSSRGSRRQGLPGDERAALVTGQQGLRRLGIAR